MFELEPERKTLVKRSSGEAVRWSIRNKNLLRLSFIAATSYAGAVSARISCSLNPAFELNACKRSLMP